MANLPSGRTEFNWQGNLVREMMREKANNELLKLSNFVLNSMQRQAPVRTGFLRSSMSFTHHPATLSSEFRIAAPYSVYVEFGTRFMSPRPYIRPALYDASGIWKFGVVLIELHPPSQRMEPLRAHTGGFYRPKIQKLTKAQEKHVRTKLVPISKMYAARFKKHGVKYRVKGP